MYNLIFIDDEITFLESLIPSINWNELDFKVSAKFDDPYDALEYIEHNHIDLVVTDIRMPAITGVELVKIITQKYPHILIVFLSAYSKFEYAQEALRYDAVVDYLLKPIGKRDLIDVVKKVKQRLDKKLIVSNSYEEEFISGYLLGSIDKKSFIEYMDKSDFNIYDTPFSLVSVEIKDYDNYMNNIWPYGKDRLYTAIGNQFYTMDIRFILYQILPDKLMYAVYLDHDVTYSNFKKKIDSATIAIEEYLNTELKCEAIIEVFQSAESFVDIKASENVAAQIKNAIQMTLTNIYNNDYEKTCQGIENVFLQYKNNLDFLHLYTDGVCNRLFDSAQLKKTWSLDVYKYDSVDSLKKFIFNNIDYFRSNINGKEVMRNAIISYIKENIRNDIGLVDVAEFIGVTPQSLSRIMKRDFNVKFVDLITQIRMDTAKKYLRETDKPVRNIIELVGFRDERYFRKIFTNHVGCTPSEYRKMVDRR